MKKKPLEMCLRVISFLMPFLGFILDRAIFIWVLIGWIILGLVILFIVTPKTNFTLAKKLEFTFIIIAACLTILYFLLGNVQLIFLLLGTICIFFIWAIVNCFFLHNKK